MTHLKEKNVVSTVVSTREIKRCRLVHERVDKSEKSLKRRKKEDFLASLVREMKFLPLLAFVALADGQRIREIQTFTHEEGSYDLWYGQIELKVNETIRPNFYSICFLCLDFQ